MSTLLRSVSSPLGVLLLAAVSAQASWFDLPAGGAGFKLLKLDASPASLAFSGGGVGGDLIDPIRNPALDSMDRSRLAVGYGTTFQKLDGSLQQAAWSLPDGNRTWNATARFEGFEGIPGRDDEDRSTGTYSASSWAVDLGLALAAFTPGLRLGATLGTGMDMVANASSWAGWLSLGASWRPENTRWSAGLAVRNLGAGTTSGNHGERLPLIVQLGGAWHQNLGSWTLVPMLDVKKVADEDIQFPVALEARWKILALRTGYVLARDEAFPSLGLGLSWEGWIIDVGTAWHQTLGFAPAARLALPI